MGFVNRVVFHAGRAYAGQLKEGQGYNELTLVITVTLCDFELWPNPEQDPRGEVDPFV